MALNENALLTWEEAQIWINDLEEDDEPQVERLINSISSRVEKSITGRFLNVKNHTKYYDGKCRITIPLDEYPVNSVTGLYMDPSRVFDSDSLIDPSKYFVNSESGIIELYEDVTPWGVKTIKVLFNAGFETIPEDLQQAVAETITWNLGRFRGQGIGVEDQSAGGATVRPALTIPASAMNVFREYRRPIL